MSNSHDPGEVLRHLASTLDIDRTLAAFPGLTREGLRDVINSVTPGQELSSGAVLMVDGAARGNPGEAGAGIVLQKSGDRAFRQGEYLGEATNNVAEYQALLLGMQKAADLGVRNLEVKSDSELVVKQLNGQYKVKNPQLQDFYFTVIRLAASFERVTFRHVPRDENREADRLANLAIDAKDRIEL